MKIVLALLVGMGAGGLLSCSSDKETGALHILSSDTPLVQQVAVTKIAPQPKKRFVVHTPVVPPKPMLTPADVKTNEVKCSPTVPLTPVPPQDAKIVVLPLRPSDM